MKVSNILNRINGFVYFQPEVLRMLLLGFSAGLPYLLVMGTFSLLLKDAGVSRTDIGYASWIGLAYSIKIFWSPIVDNIELPVLEKKLGKRRSWLFISQMGIVVSLLGISFVDASSQLEKVIIFALLTAFFSATQDIVIDAFRVESNQDKTQGAAAATYILGYRVAMIVAGAGALFLAEDLSWRISYQIMASCMCVGFIGLLLSPEPKPKIDYENNKILNKKISDTIFVLAPTIFFPLKKLSFIQFTIKSILSPLADFFIRFKYWGLIIILFILTYRISDIVMGVMTNVFYIELGFLKSEIATISKIYGLIMTIVGAIIGGLLVNYINILRCLFIGIILVILTNLLFVYMATIPKNMDILVLVISADNLAGGFSQGVLMAYFATLVNKEFTATQYAFYTSIMTILGKLIGGLSGANVDSWGYQLFFIYSASLGIPAMILILILMSKKSTPLTSKNGKIFN